MKKFDHEKKILTLKKFGLSKNLDPYLGSHGS